MLVHARQHDDLISALRHANLGFDFDQRYTGFFRVRSVVSKTRAKLRALFIHEGSRKCLARDAIQEVLGQLESRGCVKLDDRFVESGVHTAYLTEP